jgi:hypothetical protein
MLDKDFSGRGSSSDSPAGRDVTGLLGVMYQRPTESRALHADSLSLFASRTSRRQEQALAEWSNHGASALHVAVHFIAEPRSWMRICIGAFARWVRSSNISRSRSSSAVKRNPSDLSPQAAEREAGRCCWGVCPCAKFREAIGGWLQLP